MAWTSIKKLCTKKRSRASDNKPSCDQEISSDDSLKKQKKPSTDKSGKNVETSQSEQLQSNRKLVTGSIRERPVRDQSTSPTACMPATPAKKRRQSRASSRKPGSKNAKLTPSKKVSQGSVERITSSDGLSDTQREKHISSKKQKKKWPKKKTPSVNPSEEQPEQQKPASTVIPAPPPTTDEEEDTNLRTPEWFRSDPRPIFHNGKLISPKNRETNPIEKPTDKA